MASAPGQIDAAFERTLMPTSGFVQVEGRQGYQINPATGLPVFGVNLPEGFRAAATALTPEMRAAISSQLAAGPAQEQANMFLSELLGLGHSQLGLQAEQAAQTNALLARLLGLSEQQVKFGLDRFGEVSPLRNALIGAVGAEMGLPTRQPILNKKGRPKPGKFTEGVFPTTPEARELFRPDISPEIETSERGLSLAREEILSSTPGRGGALQASLTQIPLERARTRTGLVQAANEVRRQRVLSLASALGLESPALAQQGLAAGAAGVGSAAGTSAGLTGQFGQLGLGALSSGLSGATTLSGQALAQQLGLAELAQQERLGAASAESGKKGATGAGAGSAIGGIAGIIAIAI